MTALASPKIAYSSYTHSWTFMGSSSSSAALALGARVLGYGLDVGSSRVLQVRDDNVHGGAGARVQAGITMGADSVVPVDDGDNDGDDDAAAADDDDVMILHQGRYRPVSTNIKSSFQIELPVASSSKRQPRLGTPPSNPTRGQDDPGGLHKIHRAARQVMNTSPCRWRTEDGPCDAVLASHHLLTRHVHKHIQHAVSLARSVKEDLAPIHCGWFKCRASYYDRDAMLRHVESAHLEPKVGLFCPFKDCDRRHHVALGHYDDTRRHPKQWTHETLLPTPRPSRPIVTPPPTLRPGTIIPPYMLSCPAALPFPRNVPLPVQSAHSSYHTGPRVATLQKPIMPDRSDIPFLPGGEAPPGYFTRYSCSIFPPNLTESGAIESLPQVVPSTSKHGAAPLAVRERPLDGKTGRVLPGRPRLFPPLDLLMAARKEQQAKERLSARKRRRREWEKAKTVEGSPEEPDQPTFTSGQVHDAAMRVAARKTGRSIGYEFWKEVVQFEAEGPVLGARIAP
ncbi:hypothetical protein IAU60_001509 [Kwoniella sp. DSM 27419]